MNIDILRMINTVYHFDLCMHVHTHTALYLFTIRTDSVIYIFSSQATLYILSKQMLKLSDMNYRIQPLATLKLITSHILYIYKNK